MKKKQDSLQRFCDRHRKAIQKLGKVFVEAAKRMR